MGSVEGEGYWDLHWWLWGWNRAYLCIREAFGIKRRSRKVEVLSTLRAHYAKGYSRSCRHSGFLRHNSKNSRGRFVDLEVVRGGVVSQGEEPYEDQLVKAENE